MQSSSRQQYDLDAHLYVASGLTVHIPHAWWLHKQFANLACGTTGVLTFPRFSWAQARQLFLITVLYTINTAFALVGLKTLNVPMWVLPALCWWLLVTACKLCVCAVVLPHKSSALICSTCHWGSVMVVLR